MAEVKNMLIVVNSGADKPYNDYASYVVAFLAKQLAKVDSVTAYYGPLAIGMTRKGELAKLIIASEVKEKIFCQDFFTEILSRNRRGVLQRNH